MRLNRFKTRLTDTPRMVLEATARVAQENGISAHILGDSIESDAAELGRKMA